MVLFIAAVAAAAGNAWFEPSNSPELAAPAVWRGVAWNDLDGDGDADLAASHGEGVVLFRNDAGQLRKVSTIASPRPLSGEGVALMNVDGDARPDLFVANRSGPPRLYRNDGNLSFALVEDDLASIADPSHGGCFADFDGDGWLDLAVITRDDADDVLLRNVSGRFRRTDALKGSRGDGRTCAVGDWDGDARPDLYVGNFLDRSQGAVRRATDRLHLNRGALRFEPLERGHVVSLPSMTYGATSVDWNEDGLLDLAITHDGRADRNALYENRAQSRGTVDLYPRGEEIGLTVVQRGPSKGQVLADFDNDGDYDVFHAEGTEGLTAADAPFDVRDELYERDGNRFVRRDEPVLDSGMRLGAGAAVADIDLDGDADLLVANWGGESGEPLQLYRNRNGGRFVTIALRGRGPNVQAIGAKVSLTLRDGQRQAVRHAFLWPQTGYASMNEPVVHFGLGATASPVAVEIAWPDGSRSSHPLSAAGRTVIDQPPATTP